MDGRNYTLIKKYYKLTLELIHIWETAFLRCTNFLKANSLSGSEPIVGQDKCKAGQKCAASQKSCSDDKPARERVAEKGYHYAPLYRNIYGHSPRKTGLKSIYA